MPSYAPPSGMAWNPLASYPRNASCPCGSGQKFKKCHAGFLQNAPCVRASLATALRDWMDKKASGIEQAPIQFPEGTPEHPEGA